MEEKGEIAGTLDGEPIAVDKQDGVINKSLTMRQNQDSECRITDFSGLTVIRLPSHGETGTRLMVRRDIKDESKNQNNNTNDEEMINKYIKPGSKSYDIG